VRYGLQDERESGGGGGSAWARGLGLALGRGLGRCGRGRERAWAREGEAAEVGMGTTPAREGHGVGRGVGRCEGAGWGARRAAARERGGHRGRRGLGHPLHVRNRRMCRPRRGARRLRRRKRRRQRAGGCSARARQLHGERGRARGVGAYVGSTSRTMARATTRKSGRRVGCSTASPPRALRCTAAHARRRHDRPASATIRIHHRRRRPLVMVAAAAAERRRRRRNGGGGGGDRSHVYY
jgi:hypothetical protein